MSFQKAGGLISRQAFSRVRLITNPRPTVSNSILQMADTKTEVDPGVVEGTNLRIVKYPHPSLRAVNKEVTEEELKDGSIAQLAKEMFLVM